MREGETGIGRVVGVTVMVKKGKSEEQYRGHSSRHLWSLRPVAYTTRQEDLLGAEEQVYI